eukprot:scaffold103912_cov17-Prasinocladus_malaysianus.AAC.1
MCNGTYGGNTEYPPSLTPAACVMPGIGAYVFCCGYILGSCAVRGTDHLENTEQVGNHGAWTVLST